MEGWPAPITDITRHWNAENKIPTTNDCATSPKYKLVVGKRKYGNGTGIVEATTFKVICKDTDGLYLKALMPASWQRADKPRGCSFPPGRI
eukprot:15360248-Ditylum_brightwellii.AAC.1